MKMQTQDLYTEENSGYLRNNPSWHVEDARWKADNVLKILHNNSIVPKSVAEVGCGAGEILRLLHQDLPDTVVFNGFDISSDAIKLAKTRERERLTFEQSDFTQTDKHFDVLLMLDVFEHVEDYYGFIRKCAAKADYVVFSIPLEYSVIKLLSKSYLFSESTRQYGHIHFFSTESALLTLQNAGLSVQDYHFTSKRIYNNSHRGITLLIRKLFTRLFGERNAADILGQFHLYVCAKVQI
ncbi:hypothetical protein FACS1894214_3990 [Planctomycetales bacterium]|nr:hypothetical protein FACS1894214_3990 [Planctomycetales bacterium]